MLKNCRAIAAMLLLGIVFCAAVRASETRPLEADSPYVVDVWEPADGLPGSSVLSLLQTHDGYLWVGTQDGMARFDGLHFTKYSDADTPELAGRPIVDLFEDSRSNLWVGTESAGIAVIRNDGEVTNFPVGRGVPGGFVSSACEDANGSVWLKMANGVLVRSSSNRLEQVGQVSFVDARNDGPLWLASGTNLFGYVSPAGSSAMFLQQQRTVDDIKFLLASKDGGYWLLAGGRVEKWKDGRRERDLGPYPWGATKVMAVCEDAEGNPVVGTYGAGVYWFDSKGKYTHLLNELSHSFILSLIFDREGNLWVGTNGGGLNRVKRKLFAILSPSKGSVVQSISPEKLTGLWIGYNWNRVDHWTNGASVQYPLARGSYAKVVYVDHHAQVFVGVSSVLGEHLFKFDSDRFVEAGADIEDDILAIQQDRASNMWIGTKSGLFEWDGQSRRFFSVNDGLPAPDVHAVADDAEGNLWVGTGGGLCCLRNGQMKSIRRKESSPGEDVSCLLADSDGVLWIGTRGSGLLRLYKNQWTQYTSSDGLAGNNVTYLLEDGDNLWLGSDSGLTRAAKKSLNAMANGSSDSLNCRIYVEGDGLPTRECTEGSQPAACRTKDGVLWFPTTKGLVFVNPSTLNTNSFEPPVVIESVAIGNKIQNNNRVSGGPARVIIPPGKRDLEIGYSSLNLGAGERSRFKYSLEKEGQEAIWTDDKEGNRHVTYPQLAPGNYEFRVKACNEDGIWNQYPASLAIIVEPRLWQRGWFQGLIVLGTLAAIAGIVYYFSTQKLQRQLAIMRQQEMLEHERARIARDLHDQLGANLTQVALLAEMAESDRNLPQEVEDHAQQISQTARETTKALDEIVWAVNPSNDTLEGLVNYAGKYAQEYFNLAGLRYRVDMPSQLPDVTLPPDVRHNVFLAFKESVNNVVKHAQANEVHARLRVNETSFTFEIEDNGRGPAGADQKTGRNGLRNMRKRMEDVGGNFSIGPAAEKGTIVRLMAPFKNNQINAS